MKRMFLAMLASGLVLLVLAARAHHSFAAIYDFAKPITVTGTVSMVEWTNPHARIYVDVKNDSGSVDNWE